MVIRDVSPAPKRLSVLQAVCLVVAAVVLVGFGLIVTGVAVLFGTGWALVAAGALLCVGAVGSGVALLSEPQPVKP